MCMLKGLFNTKIKLFSDKQLPRSRKCQRSWCKSILEIFPLSIKSILLLLGISTIFSLTFLITVYGSLFLKAIQKTKRSTFTVDDLHLLNLHLLTISSY